MGNLMNNEEEVEILNKWGGDGGHHDVRDMSQLKPVCSHMIIIKGRQEKERSIHDTKSRYTEFDYYPYDISCLYSSFSLGS